DYQAPRIAVFVVVDGGGPLPGLPHRQRGQLAAQLECFPTDVEQRQDLVVNPHQDVPAALGYMGDARRRPINAVAQQEVAGGHRDTAEGLAPLGVGHFQEVALQVLQVDAVV